MQSFSDSCRPGCERVQSYGLVNDLIVGVVGAFLGGILFSLIGLSASGLIGSLITATVGAIVFLYLLRTIGKRY